MKLQRGLWTNQLFPCVTTQWGWAVLPISNQCIQRVSLLVNHDKVELISNLHTETDLGEGCVPVGRQFRFQFVKPSLPSGKVVYFVILPIMRVKMKGGLKKSNETVVQFLCENILQIDPKSQFIKFISISLVLFLVLFPLSRAKYLQITFFFALNCLHLSLGIRLNSDLSILIEVFTYCTNFLWPESYY